MRTGHPIVCVRDRSAVCAGDTTDVDVELGKDFHVADGGFTNLTMEWAQTDQFIGHPTNVRRHALLRG